MGNDRALDELGARLRDSGQLTVMLDELPTNTGELSEYCNRLQVSVSQVLRDLIDEGVSS